MVGYCLLINRIQKNTKKPDKPASKNNPTIQPFIYRNIDLMLPQERCMALGAWPRVLV